MVIINVLSDLQIIEMLQFVSIHFLLTRVQQNKSHQPVSTNVHILIVQLHNNSVCDYCEYWLWLCCSKSYPNQS